MSMWRNYIKCKYMFLFLLKNLARKGLTSVQGYYKESMVTLDYDAKLRRYRDVVAPV